MIQMTFVRQFMRLKINNFSVSKVAKSVDSL
jgi:hypothetical protein